MKTLLILLLTATTFHAAAQSDTTYKVGNWEYQATTNRMTGTLTTVYRLTATPKEYTGYSTLFLRTREGKTDIILGAMDDMFVPTGRYRIKFDDERPIPLRIGTTVDDNLHLVFIENDIIDKIRTAKQILIEAPLYNKGATIIEFNL